MVPPNSSSCSYFASAAPSAPSAGSPSRLLSHPAFFCYHALSVNHSHLHLPPQGQPGCGWVPGAPGEGGGDHFTESLLQRPFVVQFGLPCCAPCGMLPVLVVCASACQCKSAALHACCTSCAEQLAASLWSAVVVPVLLRVFPVSVVCRFVAGYWPPTQAYKEQGFGRVVGGSSALPPVLCC
jgi:hypothetical protein